MRLGFSLSEQTVTVKVPEGHPEAAEFEIGFIPSGLYDELSVQYQLEGPKEGTPKEIREYMAVRRSDDELVRWGVKGHKNLVDRTDTAVPFETEETKFDGVPYPVVARKLVNLYRGAGLIQLLAVKVIEHQRLLAEEKKSSPSPSSSTP